jgi:hypothetical protein
MEERKFTKNEVKEMCLKSYMRGMMFQYETQTLKRKSKPRKTFVSWVEDLITKCPVNKF